MRLFPMHTIATMHEDKRSTDWNIFLKCKTFYLISYSILQAELYNLVLMGTQLKAGKMACFLYISPALEISYISWFIYLE